MTSIAGTGNNGSSSAAAEIPREQLTPPRPYVTRQLTRISCRKWHCLCEEEAEAPPPKRPAKLVPRRRKVGPSSAAATPPLPEPEPLPPRCLCVEAAPAPRWAKLAPRRRKVGPSSTAAALPAPELNPPFRPIVDVIVKFHSLFLVPRQAAPPENENGGAAAMPLQTAAPENENGGAAAVPEVPRARRILIDLNIPPADEDQENR